MDLRNGFDIKRYIRTIPDYPKPGIMFRDITTLLVEPARLPRRGGRTRLALPQGRDRLCGGDRGARLHPRRCRGRTTSGRGFIPIRKKGKLPARVIGQEYALEYGVDTIEIHADAIQKGDRVLLIDDLIATGGTAGAAIDLIRKSGGEVVAAAFVIDLPELGGAAKLKAKGVKVHTLVSFEGH